MKVKIITENLEALTEIYPNDCADNAVEYLNDSCEKNLRIVNLCSNYSYQSTGYYVSLLAEARGHKVLPNVMAIQDINIKNTCVYINDELYDTIQQSLKFIQSDSFELSVYFGKNIAKTHNKLARQLLSLIPFPLFKVFFYKNKHWCAKKIKPVSLKEIPLTHHEFLAGVIDEYMQKRTPIKINRGSYHYDIAVLCDLEEKTPPSNKKAIDKFIKLGRKLNLNLELVDKHHYKIIGEYDGLFIRETTSVNHHTYRFARKAASEGLTVIDDPASILKCTNKVYLAELLQKHRINTPKTIIINKVNYDTVLDTIDYPCVIKLPDSAFSKGVVKAQDKREAAAYCKDFFKNSDLLIVQKFMPSSFDWRIGIIDQKPLFACRYYMAKQHWQIYNWDNHKKDDQMGMFDTVPIDLVPKSILQTAIKATSLIGKSLYGVDIKEVDGKAYVIEVNDNPNLDAGVEDQCLGDELYMTILSTFKERLDVSHGLK